jgi:hypothetical protein
MRTDPDWLQVQAALDRELRVSPNGTLAARVRQAAVRIEVGVSPLVSHDARSATLGLDTRPWISTAVSVPYFVELYASMDGGEWTLVAAADSGATCDARVVDVAWPAPPDLGFHHVQFLADVYQLAGPARGGAARCGIRQGEGRKNASIAPSTSARTVTPPRLVGPALSRERKRLPGLSFGLLDTGASRLRAGNGRGHGGSVTGSLTADSRSTVNGER